MSTSAQHRPHSGRRDALVVGLVSTTLLSLELVWTRLFSAEFYYTFAFLVLSLAVMGLGLGALSLRLVPFLDRPHVLPACLLLTAAAALAGPPLVFILGLELSLMVSSIAMLGRFVVAVVLLASPFFFGGIVLARLFRQRPQQIPALYMADLVGASAGVLAAVWLMNAFGTPAATVLSSLPVMIALLVAAPGWWRLAPIPVGIAVLLLAPAAGGLLEQKREERAPVIYEHWDAMAKIKVYDHGPQFRGVNIDNIANTGVYRFDGEWASHEPFQFGIDVGYLLRLFDRPTFLSLGAGGGSDVLQALQYDAGRVHAVEVNSHINRMMIEGDPDGYRWPKHSPPSDTQEAAGAKDGRKPAGSGKGQGAPEQVDENRSASNGGPEGTDPDGDETGQADDGGRHATTVDDPPVSPPLTLAEFSGHIYSDPRVLVVSEDARAYVRRFREEFDVIYSLSSNTFSAVASGSFAMAESYLFTTEAFRDYWRALAPGGFMMMEHQFYMPRLVASLIDALEAEGVEDLRSHFAVYDLPKMRRNVLLLAKKPLTDEIRRHAFGELTDENFEDIHLLYPAPAGLEDNLINRIVTEGWRAVASDAPVQVSPTTDDRPFVGQMGRWKNLSRDSLEKLRPLEVFGLPLARMIILTILAVVVVLVLPLNLLPFITTGPKLGPAAWGYFFLIGSAFMAVEVVLIQQFTLFVGPAVHSIATILLVLLLASGLGSRFSPRVPASVVFAGIAVWLVVDIVSFAALARAFASLPVPVRVFLTAAAVAPLGFLMGMPFPKAVARVGKLVDWGFAVNGAASVLGATGILLVAFSFGLSAALGLGGLLYLVAFWLLRRQAGWQGSES